jgi:hypothetical protein
VLGGFVALLLALDAAYSAVLVHHGIDLVAQWFAFQPAFVSLTAYTAEMAALSVLGAIASVVAFARARPAGAALALTGLVTLGIQVGNLLAGKLPWSFASALFADAQLTVAWVIAALAVVAIAAGALRSAGGSAVTVGVVAGWVVLGALAGVAVATSPGSLYYSGAPVTGAPSVASGTGSGDQSQTGRACPVGPGVLVSSIRTGGGTVTVCRSPGGGYMLHSRIESEYFDAAAHPILGGFQARTGGVTYRTTADSVAAYRHGKLISIESSTGSRHVSATGHTGDPVAELAALVRLAHDGRVIVVSLDEATQHCPASPSTAKDQLQQIVANRTQLVAAANRLAGSATGSIARPAQLFATAMRDSLTADHAWRSWIRGVWVPWVNDGCSGHLARNGNSSWEAFEAGNAAATADKKNFVSAYDPVAAENALRSDWQASDV